MSLLVVQSRCSHAREFGAESDAKHYLCQESLGVGKTKVVGLSKNSFIF